MTPNEGDVSGLEAMLARHVMGDLAEPLRVLFDSHLQLSTRNHAFVRDLEALGGAGLETIEPEPLSDGPNRLKAIVEHERDPALAPGRGDPRSGMFPPALSAYLGEHAGNVPWRGRLPGFKEYHVPNPEGLDASLLWIRAGLAMPHHTHEGTEVTLVLQGAFADASGRYGRGDVALADDKVDHRPIAEKGEDCICFAVADAPLRLTGPIGRFLQPFLKR